MRVILGFVLSVAGDAAVASMSCQGICDSVKECQPKGSYCKFSQTGDNVCYGLYFRDLDRTIPCFADDPSCPQAIPIRCPTTPSPPPSTITCESICAITPSCAFSPTHQGTYCEVEREVPVCFGLFWRDAAETITCYWQADRTCPQLDPVRCG